MPGTPSEPGLLSLAREDLACVFARDPAARSRLEVLLTYPGLPTPVKAAGCLACAAGELCCEEHGRG